MRWTDRFVPRELCIIHKLRTPPIFGNYQSLLYSNKRLTAWLSVLIIPHRVCRYDLPMAPIMAAANVIGIIRENGTIPPIIDVIYTATKWTDITIDSLQCSTLQYCKMNITLQYVLFLIHSIPWCHSIMPFTVTLPVSSEVARVLSYLQKVVRVQFSVFWSGSGFPLQSLPSFAPIFLVCNFLSHFHPFSIFISFDCKYAHCLGLL